MESCKLLLLYSLAIGYGVLGVNYKLFGEFIYWLKGSLDA